MDGGGSKTHALIASVEGEALSLGVAGYGNCSGDNFERAFAQYTLAVDSALQQAGLRGEQITASGFGLAGYDWPSETEKVQAALDTFGLGGPRRAVNDTIIGLIGGSTEGWGVVVVAGRGENCRGRDRHGRESRTVGDGYLFGDGGGGDWLVLQSIRAVATAWTGRNPPTRLTELLLNYTHTSDVTTLMEGLSLHRIQLDHAAAPLVFEAATRGDAVALEILEGAGRELGLNAAALSRQLNLENDPFEVVLVGSIFNGSHPALKESLKRHVLATAPHARFIRPIGPPVVGAVLLAMEAAKVTPSAAVRQRLNETTLQLMNR